MSKDILVVAEAVSNEKNVDKEVTTKNVDKENVDTKTTVRIWKSIIWSFVDFQRRNFKRK